jgi:hypothetical protein
MLPALQECTLHSFSILPIAKDKAGVKTTLRLKVPFAAPVLLGIFQECTRSMITRIVGRILFPRRPAWERQRRANSVVLVLLTCVSFGAVVTFIMVWTAIHHY